MTTLTRVCRFLPPEFPEDTAALLRLLAAIREPESVEGWDPRLARLEAIEDALRDPFMDKATAFELLDEMASIQISLEKG